MKLHHEFMKKMQRNLWKIKKDLMWYFLRKTMTPLGQVLVLHNLYIFFSFNIILPPMLIRKTLHFKCLKVKSNDKKKKNEEERNELHYIGPWIILPKIILLIFKKCKINLLFLLKYWIYAHYRMYIHACFKKSRCLLSIE